MAGISHIDEIIDYTGEAIRRICASQAVLALIADDPALDLSSSGAAQWKEHIYDYNGPDTASAQQAAYVIAQTEVVKNSSGTFKELSVSLQILCAKSYMRLDSSKFAADGNRRDNIARQIDLLLNGSTAFGVWRMELTSAVIADEAKTPEGFTARTLKYRVVNYARDRKRIPQ